MKFNLYFLIFLVFSIIAVFIDYLVYLTGITYWIALLISFVIVVGPVIYLIIKKKIKIEFNFDIYDLIFLAIFLGLLITNIATPDSEYDTLNYHIYLQESFNIQKLTSDFLVGSIRNTFLFPLGDRINYIFRYLLGYRMGTIFEYFSVLVLYYQVKRIIFKFIKREKHERLFPCICSFLFLISIIFRMFLGTYYIDIYSIIFPLEILIMFLKNDNIFNSKKDVYLIFLFTGLATGIKVTNFILTFPILLYFFVKNIKKFKCKMIPHYLIGILIFIFPFILYLIDNQIQTGSILFPYYNNILKSKYFYLYSWKDSRFGTGSLMEKMFWPIYLVFEHKGYGDGYPVADYIWFIGFTLLLFIALIKLIKRFSKDKIKCEYQDLINITLILNYMWIFFLEGYPRYALIVLVLYLAIISIYILDFNILNKFFNNKFVKTYLGYFVTLASSLYLIISIVFMLFDKNYMINCKYLFKDNNYKISFDYPIATTWDTSKFSVLVRKEGTPIINIREDDTYNNKIIQMMNDYIDKYEYMYLIIGEGRQLVTFWSLYNRFDIAEEYTYTIEDIPYLDATEKAYVYKIKKIEKKD